MMARKATKAEAAGPEPDYVEVKLNYPVTVDGDVFPAGATHIIVKRERLAQFPKDAVADVRPIKATD